MLVNMKETPVSKIEIALGLTPPQACIIEPFLEFWISMIDVLARTQKEPFDLTGNWFRSATLTRNKLSSGYFDLESRLSRHCCTYSLVTVQTDEIYLSVYWRGVLNAHDGRVWRLQDADLKNVGYLLRLQRWGNGQNNIPNQALGVSKWRANGLLHFDIIASGAVWLQVEIVCASLPSLLRLFAVENLA
jgi:hypothetical protein